MKSHFGAFHLTVGTVTPGQHTAHVLIEGFPPCCTHCTSMTANMAEQNPRTGLEDEAGAIPENRELPVASRSCAFSLWRCQGRVKHRGDHTSGGERHGSADVIAARVPRSDNGRWPI